MLPRRNPEVLFKPVTDGAVLLHVTDEVYFGLNAVGARVWEHLPPASTTFEELCEKIQAEYSDAGIEEIRTDVQELLAELLQHGLVVAASGDEAEKGDVAVPAS
jgi:hypothetical protein